MHDLVDEHDTPASVLAVDDAPVNLQLIQTVLKNAGYRVLTAESGADALEIAQREPIDCILLDVMMHEMDGFEICRRLKADARTASVPVIFLTALSDTENVTRGFDVGGVDYVPKPFRRPELIARVRTHVEIRRMTESLRKQSVTDGLTGLHNHSHIVELLHQECERVDRYSGRLSILLLDIDHFKRVNDEHGHAFGDQVLRAFASEMCSAARDVDHAGRYGGEEFLLVLPSTAADGAAKIAERIRAAMERRSTELGAGWPTVSCGIAQYRGNEPFAELVNRADQALYQAKREGRNRVVTA